MRKSISLLLGALFIFGMTTSLFAETTVLIDFNKLKANGNGFDPAASLAEDDAKMKDFKDHDPKTEVKT